MYEFNKNETTKKRKMNVQGKTQAFGSGLPLYSGSEAICMKCVPYFSAYNTHSYIIRTLTLGSDRLEKSLFLLYAKAIRQTRFG